MRTKKNVLIVLLSLFSVFQLDAALPDGTIAPDWTLIDLNGNSHHLYEYLNSGKSVVIDFSATWCGPCWNYHNNGTLETLWDLYGPDGTDEIMVFFLEGDTDTNDACLYGDTYNCTGGTQGDWTAGTGYPICNIPPSQASVVSDYQISYWPTLYVICADNKKTYEAGQVGVAQWESWLFESCPLSATYVSEDAFCFEEGLIDLTTEAGYGTLDFDWSNGASTEDIIDIGPGFYSVSITDENGHSIEVNDIEITGVDVPLEVQQTNQVDVDCFGSSTGQLSVVAVNGWAPYTYSWSNGAMGETAYDLQAGDYTVSIIDLYTCMATKDFTITEPDELFVSTSVVDATCGEENGEMTLSGSGGTGSAYQFDIGDGYSYQAEYTNLAPGFYNVWIKDENNCESLDIAYIFPGQAPVADAGADAQLTCSMNSLQLDGSNSSSGANITYLWTTSDGNIVSGETTLTPTVDAAGTYTLSVSDNNDNCLETDLAVVTSQGSPPTVSIDTADVLTCSATTVTLDATASDSGANFTNSWTTTEGNIVSGDTTLTPVVDGVGTYTLEITNTDNGCVNTEEIVVEEDVAVPSFTVNSPEISCEMPEVQICVTPVANVDHVIWEDGTNALCIIVNSSGTYSFTAYATNDCTTAGESVVTGDDSLPTSEAGENQTLSCVQTTVTLDGSGSSQGAEFTYSWSDEAGNVLGTTVTIDVDATGSYTLQVTNTSNGCSSTDQVVVDEFINSPDASYSETIDYNIVHLSSNSVNSSDVSSWTVSDGQTADGFEVTFVFMQSGDYEICHSLTNECGTAIACDTTSIIISALTYTFTDQNVTCPGGNDGSLSVVGEGGIPAYSISWTGPDGFTSTEFELTGLAAGDYTMTMTDQAGTVVTETFTINQPDAFEVSSTISDEIDGNSNGSIDVTVTGGTPPYTYAWSNGMSSEDLDGLVSGDYTLVITDANGCIFEVEYTVDSKTDAKDLDFVELFELSPNPTFGQLKVKIKLERLVSGKLILINKLGQLIYTENMNSTDQSIFLDMSDYDSGIYFVKFETPEGSITKKVLKL